MKRAIDLCFAVVCAILGAIPLAMVAIAVKLTSKGPILYWSDRIGAGNRIFSMPKFRTMRLAAPEVASHLLADSDRWLTPIGNFLRRTSLDELPQVWSILTGDMTLVGPRPALHNQYDLVALRTYHGVHMLTPGLTGWAQINGRDETPIPEKVGHDKFYLDHRSIWFDLKIIVLTFFQVVAGKGTRVPTNMSGVDQGVAIPAVAYLASAVVWYDLGEFDRAIVACDRAIEVDPDNTLAYNNRGAIWLAKGDRDKAQEDYDSATRLSPEFQREHPQCEFVRVTVNAVG